jgi:hypothetical protein
MNLELKHLSPYLPYDLQLLYMGNEDKKKVNSFFGMPKQDRIQTMTAIKMTAIHRGNDNYKPLI